MSISVSVIGATGRMGQVALALIEQESDLSLHSALNSQSELSESLGADILLDLTRPEVSEKVVDFALENSLRLVVGTSGWSKQKLEALEAKIANSKACISVVPNFSIGSVLATRFAAEASKYFENVEIIETHHTSKLDAPSGTALYTSQEIHRARAGRPSENVSDAPLFNGVPIKSVRIDGAHAEQEVFLSQPHESLYVKHVVSSHEIYANGILLAIRETAKRSGLSVGLAELMGLK